MARIPLLKTEKFLPGLKIEHELTLGGVGVSTVTTTMVCNSGRTAAQLIASPPNTATGASCGPVVHSLGTAPALVQFMQVEETAFSGVVTFQYCTADNSAVYAYANKWTGTAVPGVSVRMVAVR